MPIAREGYLFIGGGLFLAIAVQLAVGGYWAVPFWMAAVFVVQFFRDPKRTIPNDKGAIVSPADGKVVGIATAIEPITGSPSIKIAIFLDVFSVHANRIPVAGKILHRQYRSGKFFNASLDKASADNERNIVVIQTENSQLIGCVQIAGLIARRILCYVEERQHVSIGQRYGFIRFGSRVELFVPADSAITVEVGDKVKGGCDIVGYLP